MESKRSRLSRLLNKTENKAPRLFNIIMIIIIPFIVLIFLAMICGHFLAVLESGNKLDTLHNKTKSFDTNSFNNSKLLQNVVDKYDECLDDYTNNCKDQLINGTELEGHIKIALMLLYITLKVGRR